MVKLLQKSSLEYVKMVFIARNKVCVGTGYQGDVKGVLERYPGI